MDALGQPHKTHENAPVTKAKKENGDLNKMLYSLYGEEEMNYYYDTDPAYSYVTETESVEDMWIETASARGTGTALMFRDSFGNTLVPLMADPFASAWFTRESLYRLEKHIDEHAPDVVILEKVERNLAEFMRLPPLFTAQAIARPAIVEETDSDTTIEVGPLEFDRSYLCVSGEIDKAWIREQTDILVEIDDVVYPAFHTGQNTYAVYLKQEEGREPARIRVIAVNEGRGVVVKEL